LRRLLPDIDVHVFHLPHHHGSSEVLHLRSLLNPISPQLVTAYLPLLPVPLVELLEERQIRLIEVPEEEFETMGSNVLGLDAGRALALAGNDGTRRRLEAAGVEVLLYNGNEISRNGDGGPTCLTLPLPAIVRCD
jgi:N-dimethylarginine dimethylaminohydrolase